MTSISPFASVDIPDVDLWSFLFERKDREYPDSKGMTQPRIQPTLD